MAEDLTARIEIKGVKQAGKTWKIMGADDSGNQREYTMMGEKDGELNEPPQLGELVVARFSAQEGKGQYAGKMTYWLNEMGPAAPRAQASHAELVSGEDMVSRPAEKAAPVKGPVNSYDEPEIRKNRNIAMSVCVEAAAKIHVALISSGAEFSDEAYANTVLKGYSCYSDFHLEFTGADAVPVSQETRDGVQATPAGQIPRTDWQAEADRAQEPEPTYTG